MHWKTERMEIRSFAPSDTDSVVEVWRVCGLTRPWNDPYRDIERKLTVQPELFLVGVIDGAVVGSIMAGYDGHRGWLNYLAIAPSHRGAGLGRRLVAEAEARLESLGCPKVNLQVRADNTEAMRFYASIGYAADAAVSMGRRIIAD